MDEILLKCFLACLTGQVHKNQIMSESAFPAIAENAMKLAKVAAKRYQAEIESTPKKMKP